MIPATLSKLINPLEDLLESHKISVDDDITQRLQSNLLPLEIQLMLIPMWTVRSDYHECMRPLDKAMDHYMNFRSKLLEIDQCIEVGTATSNEVVAAFDQVLALYNVYDKNQLELLALLKKVRHQILYYSRATKNDLMWNEMIKLKEIDHVAFTRRTCSFEHVVVSLFKLDENIKDSIQTSKDITRCCANYLVRIAQHFSGQLSCDSDKDKYTKAFEYSSTNEGEKGSDFILQQPALKETA